MRILLYILPAKSILKCTNFGTFSRDPLNLLFSFCGLYVAVANSGYLLSKSWNN